MKKDLAFVSNYRKALVILNLPDDFVVAENFRHGLTDIEIRKGITAYREFLCAFFDKLAENKDKIDVKRGSKYDPYGTEGDRGTSSVKECFPVFFDIAMILVTLGFHGKLERSPEIKLTVCGEDMFTVICPITEKYQSVIKMSGERKLELFILLNELGIQFNGIDFSNKIDFSKIEKFQVTSLKNEYFAVGLKLIAESALNIKDHYKLENLLNPVVLCGDFNPLIHAKPKKYVTDIANYANAQQAEIRDWIIHMDAFLLKNKCKMVQGMGGGPPFTYVKRNTNVTNGLVCIINMKNTGCFITPGVSHLSNSNSIIDMLPDNMVDMIKSGDESERFNIEQCYRNSGNMAFSRFSFYHNGREYEGCRHAGLRCQYAGVKCRFKGFSFDLSNQIVRELMTKWIKMELEL